MKKHSLKKSGKQTIPPGSVGSNCFTPLHTSKYKQLDTKSSKYNVQLILTPACKFNPCLLQVVKSNHTQLWVIFIFLISGNDRN